ncbi:MAG TPA: carboxypeptidase regulatory-like domain-containing protein [Vicinamibacterales bacterium]|nr:carboxypeptidase regulatory-like domain-containing protein [Vicinamibacterales bacterium]
MGRFYRCIGVVCTLGVLVLSPSTLAAQTGQNFGELVGKVVDDQGGVLPGVTVTLKGPAAMGAPTAVTNDRGMYRFPAVPSGTYSLTFELPGFSKLVRTDIVVPVRQTVTVDTQMRVATLQETITVRGESPVVDVENAKIGERLDNQTLQSIPTSRSIFGSATVLPGMVMVRQDPAGLNAATSTGMVAHGAATYNLNYFGVTADTPQNYGSMYYMDYNAAEEISVDTAAMGADIGGGGGANINIIPKSGSNLMKGSVYYSGTGKQFAADNVDDELRAQGITAGTRLLKLNDLNADGGGPILRDRLWWFGSARDYTTLEQVIGFPKDFKSNLRNYTARVNTEVTRGNQLSGFWTYNKKFQPNRGAGLTQPNPIGTINQQSPKNLFNLNWTSVISQARFLEVSSTYFHMHWPSRFADEFYALPDGQKTSTMQNLTTGVFFNGPEPTGERLRDAYRYQTNVAFTQYLDEFLGASHQLKSGFEQWVGWGTDGFGIFNDTRLQFRNDANGVLQPSQILAYNTPLVQETHMRNFAAFVQDRASYKRVTLNLGLRWSFYDGYLPEQSGGGGRWYAPTTYPKLDAGFNWNTLAPRTSVVWKVTDDGRNVAKASYSRYYEVMYTGEFADVINPNTINTNGLATYRWFGDANGNGIVDAGEYDPAPLSTVQPRLNRIDPNLKDPKTDEITFGFQRELARDVGMNVSWVQRWFNNQTVDTETGIPVTGYSPRTLTDPGPDNLANTSDDRPITLYDVLPQFRGQNVTFHTNFPGTQLYKGLELSLSKRLSNRWQLMGSYVWSRLDGDLVVDPNNPNQTIASNARGRGANDQPHAFKLIGSYVAPYHINVGVNYQGLSGLPFDRTFRATLAQGSTTVRAEERGTYRTDFLNLLSLKVDKTFELHRHARLSAFAEVHNLTNTNAAQSNIGTLTQAFPSQAAFDAAKATTSYFGRVQEIVAPRILKLGARFAF